MVKHIIWLDDIAMINPQLVFDFISVETQVVAIKYTSNDKRYV